MNKGRTLGKAKPFENLEDAFDVPCVMDNDPIEISDVEEKKTKNINTTSVQPATNKKTIIADESYIRFKMMELIESSTRVLEKLEDEIKVGTGDRTFEVYSELADSVNKQLVALTDMNSAVEKAKLERKKLLLKEKAITVGSFKENTKIAMTASQINALIRDATEASELKEIDAHFKVESYKDKDANDD